MKRKRVKMFTHVILTPQIIMQNTNGCGCDTTLFSFCFPYLCFVGYLSWIKTGIAHLGHLSEKNLLTRKLFQTFTK